MIFISINSQYLQDSKLIPTNSNQL